MQGHVVTGSESAQALASRGFDWTKALTAALGSTSAIVIVLALLIPLNLTGGFGILLSFLLSAAIVLMLTPPLIRKMFAGGMVGVDVNKAARVSVAELGGIAALFAFSMSLTLVVGIQKLLGDVAEPPFLAAISVFFMAAMIGLIDDVSDLRQRLKAVAVAFAALPLTLVHLGAPAIDLPFGFSLDFAGQWHLLYWLILVPIGVTGVANAMNMSAGYNGLESGQIAVISLSLLVVSAIRGAPEVALLVFGAVFGCSAGLFFFNRYPATIFIGDIGTLGLGAALAAGVILGHIEFYGVIAIAPAFYEMIATAYFGLHGANGNRKKAYRNPVFLPNGEIAAPAGTKYYTLASWLLSHKPRTEKGLVRSILLLYVVCGLCAVVLSLV